MTRHTFLIEADDFLLDGKPFQIRCGELHFARVPRAYWRHRLQLLKALGMNSVCAYLFWNYHEFREGVYDWTGQADAAEFCRLAQEEGLWVVLRPGPYVCAEWDGGGLPWWLLKHERIHLRSQDPAYMAAAERWYCEVGRVLGPLQVTHGGPILMAQVENEYGFYGKDADYMGRMRDELVAAGFDIPLFACNPAGCLRNGFRADLFNVVNFARDPANAFAKLREVQPTGPLMCGEFYPGWFDTWGAPHHLGNTPQFLADLEYMLKAGASFSLYMAHGGTTFGLWPGVDRPFKPDTNSYDYDAPISEAGWIGKKFEETRHLLARHLGKEERLPAPPAPMPVMTIPPFRLTECAPVFENLPAPIADAQPRHMEHYDQGQGCILYRCELPAGPSGRLKVERVADFAWVFLDGQPVGVMDRRTRRFSMDLPARAKPAQLDLLVEAMGHVNFGEEVHDRKGIHGPVTLDGQPVGGPWQVFPLRLDPAMLGSLKWVGAPASTARGPSFWRGTFDVSAPADTFLDLRTWGKGVVWINGICLSRFWTIGPTQSAYVPGPWLRAGRNEVLVLDLLGPSEPVLAGLEKPILDQLRLDLDFARPSPFTGTLALGMPVVEGCFAPGSDAQDIRFGHPVEARQVCLESINAHDGKPFSAIAELDVLDTGGQPVSHADWTVVHADSEELSAEDGSASNAIDGQTASYWHTAWKTTQPGHPHRLLLDLGATVRIGGFRYTPRAGQDVTGRIKDYRFYAGPNLVKENRV